MGVFKTKLYLRGQLVLKQHLLPLERPDRHYVFYVLELAPEVFPESWIDTFKKKKVLMSCFLVTVCEGGQQSCRFIFTILTLDQQQSNIRQFLCKLGLQISRTEGLDWLIDNLLTCPHFSVCIIMCFLFAFLR